MVTETGDSGETQPAPDQRAAPTVPASLTVWDRIKQHKVAQWTLAYAAAAYTVLHGTEMVSNAFDWPHLLPIVLQAAGHPAEADEALQMLITKFADRDAFQVAMTYAYRGDHDLAFQWLDRAYQQKDDDLPLILVEHLFKNIANDARYKAFLRRMNLPG